MIHPAHGDNPVLECALAGLVLATAVAVSSGYQECEVVELGHWDANSFGEPIGPVSPAAEGRYIASLGRNEESPYRIGHGPCGVFLWNRAGAWSTPTSGDSRA